MKTQPLLGAALAAALACSTGFAADDAKYSLTAGFDYTTGSYGESQDTTITQIPVTGKYESGPWTFGLTIPWIQVDGPGNVTRDMGRFRGRTTTGTRTQSGIGDIIASTTYNLFSTADGRALDLTGKIKFGTADETKGLGTGENDLYVQVDAYRTIDRFAPFATLGYRFLGDPPRIDLRDVFYASIGGGYKLDDIRSVGLMWYGQEKSTSSGSPQSEVTGFYTHKLSREWKAQLYGLLGLADGSPDMGLGATVTCSF